MNRTKIEWADRTWNPVTGCLHGCDYCFAEGITKRFCGIVSNNIIRAKDRGIYRAMTRGDSDRPLHIMDAKLRDMKGRILPFPFGFEPTFHAYRLSEPAAVKKPQNVFVVDMGDLFGEWVPDEWIREVFRACGAAPWHNYMFLTKHPMRFMEHSEPWGSLTKDIMHHKNIWIGASATDQLSFGRAVDGFGYVPCAVKTFVSLEPMLGEINIDSAYFDKEYVSWVIVGAMSGPGSKKRQPKREWVEAIVEQCRAAGVPVFLKNNLREVLGGELAQEMPEGLRRDGNASGYGTNIVF